MDTSNDGTQPQAAPIVVDMVKQDAREQDYIRPEGTLGMPVYLPRSRSAVLGIANRLIAIRRSAIRSSKVLGDNNGTVGFRPDNGRALL
jgi:hypothetical protein